MGVRSFSETRDVDLIMNGPVGTPSPTRAAPASHPSWDHYRVPWLRGRPSPTPGHARPRRDRHRRVPTQLSRGPVSPTQGDHRTVASLLAGRARMQVREARRASRNGTTPSAVLHPAHRPTAAHGAPTRVPMVTPSVRDQICQANLQMTNARALETAPTPPNSRPQNGKFVVQRPAPSSGPAVRYGCARR
jgi:hypothetical protein